MSRAASFLLTFLLTICLAGAASISIQKIELAKDDHGKAGRVVSALSPSDNPFHVVVKMKPMTESATITGTLIAIEAADVKNFKVASVDLEASKGMDQAKFKFSLPRAWPAGKYRVEIKVDGKIARSINFSIK